MTSLSSKLKRRIVSALTSEKYGKELIDAIEQGGGGGTSAVTSVAGRTGDVSLTKSDVGLGNVDNTSDANKPVSSAVSTALAAKFNNPSGTTAQYVMGNGSLATFPTNFLTKGTKTILCIDNGDYANGQAAIDAATAGSTIVFGAKAGGWGNLVIPAGKKLSLMGLQTERAVYIEIGSITYSPTTGTQIVENELYIDSLYLNTTSDCITFGGTAPARMRVNNCYLYGGSSANRLINASNSHANSSMYISECTLVNEGSTATLVDSSAKYVKMYRTSLDGGLVSLSVTAGSFESDLCTFNTNSASSIINITNTNTLLACGRALITNATANGSGVSVGTGAAFANNQNTFAVATGTGYCVKGTGVHAYANMCLSNSILLAYNVRMQSTLTNVPYTVAFTSAP